MYASPDYYKKTFVGVISADPEVLASKLKSASDKIDILTFNRIRGIGFNNLTTSLLDNCLLKWCQIIESNATDSIERKYINIVRS